MRAVRGRVTQADGRGRPGATVRVKRTGDGVTTDGEGNFRLPKPRKNDLLLVSSIDYETLEIELVGKNISVILNLDINKLEETVVIAYGTTTRRLSIGNTTTVKASDIQNQPVTNPLLAIQGRVYGLFITQNTG